MVGHAVHRTHGRIISSNGLHLGKVINEPGNDSFLIFEIYISVEMMN